MPSAKQLELRLTHIGGPTVLIELAGLRLLIDPTFDSAGSEYALGPVVLKKTSDPALLPEAIEPIDIVLLSHDQHADNLDHAGRALLPKAKTVLTTMSGAARLGGNATGLAPWSSFACALSDGRSLTITATPARHGPAGCEPVTGDVIGFMLTWTGTDHQLKTVYISGDTVWFDELIALGSKFTIDLAIVNLGNVHLDAVGRDNLTMNSAEAAKMMEELSIPRIIPVHVDGWAHFQEKRSDVQTGLQLRGLAARAIWLEPGSPESL